MLAAFYRKHRRCQSPISKKVATFVPTKRLLAGTETFCKVDDPGSRFSTAIFVSLAAIPSVVAKPEPLPL
jgi:hypothetical protein